MTPRTRRTLLLSVLASLVFWLFVDLVSRGPLLNPEFHVEGFLAPIPAWKRLLLVAVIAGVLYATARLIAAASPRRWVRRVLWISALAGMAVGTRVWLDAVAEAYSPFDSERAHMPLRFERPTLAGTAWWNVGGGECGIGIHYDVLTFESETRVRREIKHLYIRGYATVVYGLLGVWPDGVDHATGTVRGDVIYWHDRYGTRERIARERDGLHVMWAPDLMDDR